MRGTGNYYPRRNTDNITYGVYTSNLLYLRIPCVYTNTPTNVYKLLYARYWLSSTNRKMIQRLLENSTIIRILFYTLYLYTIQLDTQITSTEKKQTHVLPISLHFHTRMYIL